MHARLRNTRNSTRTYAFAKCTLAPRLQGLLLQAEFVPAEACGKAAMTMRLAELVRTVDSLHLCLLCAAEISEPNKSFGPICQGNSPEAVLGGCLEGGREARRSLKAPRPGPSHIFPAQAPPPPPPPKRKSKDNEKQQAPPRHKRVQDKWLPTLIPCTCVRGESST